MARKAVRIYLDYASATPVAPEAVAAVADGMAIYANPGGVHMESVAARRQLDGARARIAAHLGIKAREVVFTSGLTEANTLAIIGFARALERVHRTLEGTHWVVSAIEHSSVLECFAEIERMGGEVSYVQPDTAGRITPAALAGVLRPETVLVSIGWANGEIGTVQPLSALSRVIRSCEREHGSFIAFHSDAGQAPLFIAPHVHTAGLDLCSFGSGKLYGPRGVGALYVGHRLSLRPGTQLSPVVFGGGQERGLRPGTEDPALVLGFAKALDIDARKRVSETRRLSKLRDDLAREVVERMPGAIINGDPRRSLPHIVNVSFPGVQAEYLALLLDRAGFAVSTKSACREGEAASHVVAALPGGQDRARETLRISLGRDTRASDIASFVRALSTSVPKASR